MKLILSSIMVLSSFCVGFFIKKYLYDKSKFFDEMVSIIDLLKINIQFFQNDISKIFSEYTKYSHYTRKFIDGYIDYLQSDSFEKKLEDFSKLNFLSEQESNTIYSLFKMLGGSDVDSQCEMLMKYRVYIEVYQRYHRERFQKFGNLYLKMSVSIGLLIVILLI